MFRSPTILLLGICCWSCGDDASAPAQQASVHGRWLVNSATRGGRPTNTLDAAYFEFDTATTTLKTNFTGQEETLKYLPAEGGIATPDGELFQKLEIGSLSDTVLDLATEIQGTRFTFHLRPDVPGAEMIQAPFGGDTAVAPRDDDPGEEL